MFIRNSVSCLDAPLFICEVARCGSCGWAPRLWSSAFAVQRTDWDLRVLLDLAAEEKCVVKECVGVVKQAKIRSLQKEPENISLCVLLPSIYLPFEIEDLASQCNLRLL
jgi:hypothetical protein